MMVFTIFTISSWQKYVFGCSFQEMAQYDIPAMLKHALEVSGQHQLFYIGHSQGTLVGFTSFSSNPELAKKVKLFMALAPIYQLDHTAAILRDLAFTLDPIEVWIKCKKIIFGLCDALLMRIAAYELFIVNFSLRVGWTA